MAASSARCSDVTAPDQPGGRDGIHHDFLKKFTTAADVAARLPYAIQATPFNRVGWKRLEINKPVHLDPLEHASSEELLRRFVVQKTIPPHVFVA
jgi:hypothetical protein